MSKKAIVITLLVFVVLLVGVSVYLYLKYKPDNATNDTIELKVFVRATEADTEKQIKTNFLVYQGENIIYTGETQEEGLEEITLKVRKNFTMPFFMNYGGRYYSNAGGYTGGKNFNIILRKGGTPNVSLIFNNASTYILNISTGDFQYRQIGFCVKWSYNYLEVFSDDSVFPDYLKIPERFKNYDSCYYTLHSLNNQESMLIYLKYDALSTLTESDYVDVAIFDSDRDYRQHPVLEDGEGKDVAMEDVNFRI